MINRRQHFRLRMQLDVLWSVPEQKIEGDGIILNISLSGVLFVTDRLFESTHGLVMSFKVPQVPPFPFKGRLLWFRKVGKAGSERYLCGVMFFSEFAQSPQWAKWMEDNILKLAEAQNSRILGRILEEEDWS